MLVRTLQKFGDGFLIDGRIRVILTGRDSRGRPRVGVEAPCDVAIQRINRDVVVPFPEKVVKDADRTA